MTEFRIRNAKLNDFKFIEQLNDNFVQFTSPMDLARVEHLHNRCAYHKVIEKLPKNDVHNGHDTLKENAVSVPSIVGFLMAMAPKTEYDSENYRWFDLRYKNFLYVDRIVIDQTLHGIGLGKMLYDDLFKFARDKKIGHICCEYNLIPANPISADFHQSFGFHQVGRLSSEDHSKVVSMQLANAM